MKGISASQDGTVRKLEILEVNSKSNAFCEMTEMGTEPPLTSQFYRLEIVSLIYFSLLYSNAFVIEPLKRQIKWVIQAHSFVCGLSGETVKK